MNLTILLVAAMVSAATWCALTGADFAVRAVLARRLATARLAPLMPATRKRSRLHRWCDRFDASPRGRGLALTLAQADLAWRPAYFQLGVWAAILALAVTGTRILGLPALAGWLLAPLATHLGLRALFRARAGRFQQKLHRQLPELARLLSNALKANLSVQQGLELAGEQLPDPAGLVARRWIGELSLGLPLEEVLENMLARMPASDLRLLATLLLVHREAGGDLAGALEELSRTLTDREQVQAEVQAATAEQRYVVMMLPLMPVVAAAMLNLAIPGFVRPLFTVPGLILLTVSATLLTIGIWSVRRLAAIRV